MNDVMVDGSARNGLLDVYWRTATGKEELVLEVRSE